MAKSFNFPSSSVTGIVRNRPLYPSQTLSNSSSSSEPIIISDEDDDDHDQVSRYEEKSAEYLRVRREYRQIRDTCLKLGIKYTDEEFPATKKSLVRQQQPSPTSSSSGNNGGFDARKFLNSIASWQRPENVRFSGREDDQGKDGWMLIKNPHPSDIQQGQLGNCWFIAALALIAERRDLIGRIFISKKHNAAGVYALRLFKDGEWKCVLIDDLFPCDQYNRLVFSSCRRKQLWVPLIEKAMSKLHGTYSSLHSGDIADGLNYLTGFISEPIDFKSEVDRELLWARLLSFDSCEFLMGTHVTSTCEEETARFKDKGLITNHVYSVLKVVCMENNRLVQLRNPWGRFSWRGDWSDDSPLWNETLSAYLSPHRSSEGIFWMCYQDFIENFTSMEVCKIRQNWKIYTLDGILAPYADPDCQPCFELVCQESCEVDISLYQSSKRNAREDVKQTDIGLMVLQTSGSPHSKSNPFKLIKPVELTLSSRKRAVSCNLLLAAGQYCLVPFSFGHWTPKESEETFYTVHLSIHASRQLSRFTPIQVPGILADSLICCSKYHGDRQYFSLRHHSQKVSTITTHLGNGHCIILENYTTDKNVKLEVDCLANGDYISTRNEFRTEDEIPPMHCQVVQVLSAKDTGKSVRYQNSYKIQVTDAFSRLRLDDNSSGDAHRPPLNAKTRDLHAPRACENENY